MGIALWRSRSVPRWLAVLFVAGFELAQQVPSAGPVIVVLLMLPFAVAMVLLGAHVAGGGQAGQPQRTLPADPASLPATAPADAGTVRERADLDTAAYRR